MRADRWPTCLTLAVLLAGFAAVVLAGPASSPAPPQEETSAVPAEDAPPPELSDAERLIRMQSTIELDEQKLEVLRSDLDDRQTLFEDLAEEQKKTAAELAEKKQRLEDLEAGSAEAMALQTEIHELEVRYERFNRHANLTFEAEKALREQLRGLQQKIEVDRRAVALIKGTAPIEPAAALDVTAAPEAAAPPAASPAFPMVPGVPAAVLTAPAPAQVAPLLPETTEQIEARTEADKKTLEALRAEQGVVTFVQRKEALSEQIRLERILLEADEAALENLKDVLADRQEGVDSVGASTSTEELEAEILSVGNAIAQRSAHLDSLLERLKLAEAEQVRISEWAEGLRKEAESARRRQSWLESPLHPVNIGRWAVDRGPRVLAVLALAGVLLLLIRLSLRRVARVLVRSSRKARSSSINRADTLALSFQSVTTTLILMACVLLVLQEAGLDVKTVLGGAAIFGVAVAFGAQNLMRDYFTGFMMLLEDQYELGDLVTIGNITGTVERVNMRVTTLRDLEGRVHFIPNGQIGSLTNRTYDWARAVVDVPVGPEQDVDRVMALLLEVARGLKSDAEWAEHIVDDPVMLGVDKFTESGVLIKLMLKTEPAKMFAVRREMLRRAKKAFDEAGIQAGVPQRVVHERSS